MCIHCQIEDTIIDLHAQDMLSATLDGERLSTGQIESLIGSPDFERILIDLTDRGRIAIEAGAFD